MCGAHVPSYKIKLLRASPRGSRQLVRLTGQLDAAPAASRDLLSSVEEGRLLGVTCGASDRHDFRPFV